MSSTVRTAGPTARGRVHNHAQPGVGNLQFAGQTGFRHGRHADHRATVALHAVDLGHGLEARSLRGTVYAVIHQRHAGALRRVDEPPAQIGVERLAEVRVVQVLARRERVLAPPRVVDDLRGHGERPVLQRRRNATDREDRDDGADPEFVE